MLSRGLVFDEYFKQKAMDQSVTEVLAFCWNVCGACKQWLSQFESELTRRRLDPDIVFFQEYTRMKIKDHITPGGYQFFIGAKRG